VFLLERKSELNNNDGLGAFIDKDKVWSLLSWENVRGEL